MDTFTQPKINGHRQLTPEEVALMNDIKEHAEQTRHLCGRVQQYLNDKPEGDVPHSQITSPHRWAAMAISDLQTGYMKLVRAVAQPTTF